MQNSLHIVVPAECIHDGDFGNWSSLPIYASCLIQPLAPCMLLLLLLPLFLLLLLLLLLSCLGMIDISPLSYSM